MPMSNHQAIYPPLDPTRTGLQGKCPRCGQGQLFAGMLKIKPQCSNCGLDIASLDVGDGAVVFVVMIANIVVLGGALAFENAFSPPLWLHILMWPIVIAALCIWLTRLIKGVLLAHQFARNAAPGVLDQE
jgi:uncharacterized protein (DUF983 family)